MLLLAVLLLLSHWVAATTEEGALLCKKCQAEVEKLDLKWTNATSVEVILDQLKVKCLAKDNVIKKEVCTKMAEFLVTLPAAIFNGFEDLAWPVPLAPCAFIRMCEVECCTNDNVPEQIHLSLAGTDRSVMGVTWVTLTGDVSVVEYGTTETTLTSIVKGSTSTYKDGGWRGVIHYGTMTGLLPGTTYYYRVGDGSVWSDTYSFTTFTKDKSVLNFGIVADMAYDTNSDDTVASLTTLVNEGKIDVIIHSGDISYADGFEPHFDDFFRKIQPLATRVPYMACPGNHEFIYKFESYKQRFFLPGVIDNTDSSHDNMYYSWEYGPIKFISMNSETVIDTGNFSDEEIDWLNTVMTTVDRSATPFLIATFHRPMYCSDDMNCGDRADKLKKEAEDIFYNNKVDLVITGHIHSYERTYPVYKNQIYEVGQAPIHVMQGASGNREGNKGGYGTLQAYSAAHSVDIGYGIMSVSIDGKMLDFGFYNSKTNEKLDTFSINK